jgi:hypothetical protein
MAHIVFTDGFFSWNAVDLSDHVVEVAVEPLKERRPDTVMGDLGRKNLAGLADYSVRVRMQQDFAASEVDVTIWADFIAGTVRTWIVRAVNTGGVSVTNPNYSATGFIENYAPIRGSVGDELGTEITIAPAGATPVMQRLTA